MQELGLTASNSLHPLTMNISITFSPKCSKPFTKDFLRVHQKGNTYKLRELTNMKKVLIGIPVLDNIEITRACLQHLYKNTKIGKLSTRI